MVPKLRFKEFCGEWEENRLGEAVEYITDYVAAGSFADIRKNVTYLEKGYAQLIRTIDLKNNFKNKGFIYVDKHAFEYLYRVNLNEESIVLPNIGANIGESYYINCDKLPHQYNVLAPNSILLKSKMQNNRFIYQFLKTDLFVNRLKLIVAASGQPKFNKTDLKKLKLQVPSLSEQTKVADFLSTVDDKIQNQQDKISHLENIKKGFMQKIFSRKIRFKDDGGEEFPEWEEKKLGDFLIKYDEITVKNNQYPPLTSSRKGIFLQKDYFNNRQIASEDNTGYNIVPFGYFTYRHMSDDAVFYFNINDLVEYGIVSTLYPVFTTTKKMNSIFLQYYLNESTTFKKYCILQKQGGSRTYMYFNKLKQFIMEIPCLKEQQKIADFLSLFDEKISTEKETLEHLKQLKKGLLQQMFV
ncbi:restriction endonuclease subunit S [Intestinibacter bartlettii]|uniref:restriction endonuclease subunit S n=1 Tax=Intestinibacter bartlettii TaxID=261299 RepID=UPI00290324C0|nr:restriction endonuclease subunit S [Intestinibacter bartlettii]MDU2162371.1 restriction endonuclease subunit S [Intestinibacter bartlettii]